MAFDYRNMYLPVQALKKLSMNHVFNIKGICEMANIESDTNDLSRNIVFVEENDGSLNPGEIKKVEGKYEINISLTFCQFMWAVGLYTTTVFDNIVQIPAMNAAGTNIHGYKANMHAVEFASDSFFRARRLLEPNWKKEYFFVIPNVCNPQEFEDEIGKANALTISGVAFIYAHELAHNILGHTHAHEIPDMMVKDEIDADNLAMDYLSDTFDTEDGYTNKAGIATLLCSILLMSKDSVSGGGSHPHMDVRIDMMMKRMNLHEMDVLWGLVGNAIRLWLLVYGGYSIADDMQVLPFNYYRDFYDYYLGKLRETREMLFPEYIKPAWYII